MQACLAAFDARPGGQICLKVIPQGEGIVFWVQSGAAWWRGSYLVTMFELRLPSSVIA